VTTVRTKKQPKPRFRVGQVVWAEDYKGEKRMGHVIKVETDWDNDEIHYLVEWVERSRLYQMESKLRPLSKREAGR